MHASKEQRQTDRQASEQVRVMKTEYLAPCSNDCNTLLSYIQRSAAEQ
jgi:hypothetical protein